MGDLKNQIFLQYINRALDQAREEYIKKNIPKKEKRFLIKGITYEISNCRFDNGKFRYEISSKIPQDLVLSKFAIEQFFKRVVKIMNSMGKKPTEFSKENIVQNTSEMEHKERDYVKLVYDYSEDELHSAEEVEKRFKQHQAKNIPIPHFPGVTTPSGKLVIAIVEEKMAKYIRQNMNDFIKANEEVKTNIKISSPKADKKPKAAKTSVKKVSAKVAKKASAKPTKKPAVAKPKVKPKAASKKKK